MQTLYRFIGTGGGRGDDLYVSDSTSFPPELQHLAVERLVYLQVHSAAMHVWPVGSSILNSTSPRCIARWPLQSATQHLGLMPDDALMSHAVSGIA